MWQGWRLIRRLASTRLLVSSSKTLRSCSHTATPPLIEDFENAALRPLHRIAAEAQCRCRWQGSPGHPHGCSPSLSELRLAPCNSLLAATSFPDTEPGFPVSLFREFDL